MTAATHILPTGKSPVQIWLENTLLCVVLGLIALRSMVIETPLVDQIQTRLLLSSEIVSLLVSTTLLFCMGLWLLVSIVFNQFHWRKTGFGIAVGLFIFAGILSACFASDKRAAITDFTTLTVPILMGLFLVQLLTSPVRVRLALLLILSVGVAATIQCIDQQMASNQTLIEDYEADPTAHLNRMGIQPDSMEHWMYEHRLYSEDIRGFLMTSNSAASYFLMAVFAGFGLCLQAIRKKMSQEAIAAWACYLLALLITLFGLFLTQSKGGVAAFLLGTMLLILLLVFRKTIWKRRRAFGIVVLLLIVFAASGLIHYGRQHDRLPGGNSMLVRWQYWVSAAEIIGDHILTGVGGGNFPEFYTHYKVPAASETVQNPHNWILSLLSQYGLLGLVAFLAAVLLPLYRAWSRYSVDDLISDDEPAFKRGNLWIGILVSVSIMLLLVRPVLVDAEFLYQRVDVRSAAYLVLYLFPAGVVVLSFVLLRAASLGDASINGRTDRLSIALMCGLVAVLIHNIIDFAIFELGVWGVFWLFISILVAQQMHHSAELPQNSIGLDPSRRFGLFAGLVLASIIYLMVVLVPPMRAEQLFKQAMTDNLRRIEWIETSIAADKFSSKTAYKSGLMFMQAHHQDQIKKDNRFLEKAAEFTHIAAARNPADFKPWRLLGQIEVLLAEQAEGEQKEKHLKMAFGNLQEAVERYPGSGKLNYLLAEIAEQLGRNDVALMHYQTAVEIEDAYRAQFRIMYPERKTIISRLGETAYAEAKAKIKELQKNTP